MKTNQAFRTVGESGKSLSIKMTEQLKAIGCSKKDEVKICVEEINGKKRIIIENAEM